MDYVKQKWTSKEQKELRNALQEMAEEQYRLFHQKIVKGERQIIGVRMPTLKKIAKEIVKGNYMDFIKTSIPVYHEEVVLLGIVIGTSTMEYTDFLMEMNDFIKKIDSWAICDAFCASIKKQVQNNKQAFWNHITLYLRSKNNWIVRVGLIIMLSYYLEEEYIEKVFKRCETVKSEFYYVKMAQAWLIATTWAKFPEKTEQYFKKSALDKWIWNKAIQKACESTRVKEEYKIYLKTLKK